LLRVQLIDIPATKLAMYWIAAYVCPVIFLVVVEAGVVSVLGRSEFREIPHISELSLALVQSVLLVVPHAVLMLMMVRNAGPGEGRQHYGLFSALRRVMFRFVQRSPDMAIWSVAKTLTERMLNETIDFGLECAYLSDLAPFWKEALSMIRSTPLLPLEVFWLICCVHFLLPEFRPVLLHQGHHHHHHHRAPGGEHGQQEQAPVLAREQHQQPEQQPAWSPVLQHQPGFLMPANPNLSDGAELSHQQQQQLQQQQLAWMHWLQQQQLVLAAQHQYMHQAQLYHLWLLHQQQQALAQPTDPDQNET
jgi:hypothetical protein